MTSTGEQATVAAEVDIAGLVRGGQLTTAQKAFDELLTSATAYWAAKWSRYPDHQARAQRFVARTLEVQGAGSTNVYEIGAEKLIKVLPVLRAFDLDRPRVDPRKSLSQNRGRGM
jgi:hypothetical protein